jgi:hypothetical protein
MHCPGAGESYVQAGTPLGYPKEFPTPVPICYDETYFVNHL